MHETDKFDYLNNFKYDNDFFLSRSPSPTLKETHHISKIKENYIRQYNFSKCEDFSKFKILVKIGQGTCGEVFKAQNIKNPKQIVTIKKMFQKNTKEGFSIAALREIRILQQLRNDNIISLLEICQSKDRKLKHNYSTFYLVFEFCEYNLADLILNHELIFNIAEIKFLIQEILKGLHYIHINKILHCNMKPTNVLITKTGKLKITNFELARPFSLEYSQPKDIPNRVVTLWYRPPELLLGQRNCCPSTDLWGVGCIMAEMWTRNPIFQGHSEQSQLDLISKLCGSITPEVWPNVVYLDLYNQLELDKGQKQKVEEHFKHYLQNPFAMNLLEKLLTLDPEKRTYANSALLHDFFWTDPMPRDISEVLSQNVIKRTKFSHQPMCIQIN